MCPSVCTVELLINAPSAFGAFVGPFYKYPLTFIGGPALIRDPAFISTNGEYPIHYYYYKYPQAFITSFTVALRIDFKLSRGLKSHG